ncbi:DUF6662 family protein [Novosphingobium album (ex Hu et al. 2023)]|uniref:Transporter n=1 Tax=Novosphingobium album (ex Hu et al. 2023) TaxID=2930093 RepID=A0ABT0AX05_9SPHN|nr:DUF6662 family protein [Novosphingobium album (ex Hu et al. 2023)]MCJ2177349.1 hypothetical protein [Novosphingobium album (ex Hu et al. 2023)]
MNIRFAWAAAAACLAVPGVAHADENLLGYNTGAEVLPKGSGDLYVFNTLRSDKGQGHYRAVDTQLEVEYGVTDRIQLSVAANILSIDTAGLTIDGYLPKPINKGPRFSGVELSAKFNVLSPALDNFGLAVITSVEVNRLDPHSGQDKLEYEAHTVLAAQKYFMQGQLTWIGNIGLKAGYEDRKAIANLPEGFDWPTTPEMEIELSVGTGLSYRVAPNWFIGAETQWASEYETEVGNERWSLFAGPTIHYGGKRMWATLTWFPQITGGGEKYEGQTGHLHLIEKTKDEFRLKLGYNF